jgi:hypothetical protein
MERRTKLDMLRAAYARGNFRGAIGIAAKFPQLGDAKVAVTRAWMAYTRPGFCKQIGRSPDELIEQGLVALRARYSL